jgi:vitamin B12 transporter
MSRGAGRAIGAALALALLAPSATRAALIEGVVVDRAGKPIEYATIAVPALKRGAGSDAAGRFSIELPDGPATLEVMQLGYEPRSVTIRVAAGLAPLRIVLADQPVELAEVAVSASSFGKIGKSEGATLRRMDVYLTPGGAADVFQSLRAMPGLSAPSDGAALYVRGGSPDETLVRLDGAELGHPYHYESASGGLFSAVDPYMLKSAFFSSGGFSAKYGGVLSGVLDIETSDPMNLHTVSLGANFAGGSASTSWALVPDKLSFIGAYRASDTALLFHLYGAAREYEQLPKSQDAAARLLWRYSPTGRLSLSYLDAGDRTALTVPYLAFESRYQNQTRTQFGSLQFQDAFGGKVALRGDASLQKRDEDWRLGPFGGTLDERNAQANLDGVWSAAARHEVSFGFNLRRRSTERIALAPADSTDFSPGAPTRALETKPSVDYPGVYVEDKMRVVGPIYATAGARFDWASVPGVWTADPRAALAWRVDDRQTVRVAAGRYHQLAGSQYLDPVYGNPLLGPLESTHLIAGYEWKSEHVNARVEGYHKRYDDLVTNDPAMFYANCGHGYARGVDVFVQGVHRWLTGWVSYGYLDSKRMELSNPHEVPAAYGVRHTVSLVGTYQITSAFHAGARWSFSSGRPYTPVTSASYDSAAGIWRPAFAEDNSGSLPDYQRLDLRLMRLFSLPKALGLPESGVCVAYAEALNVLDRRNVLDYTYNEDYTERSEQASYFNRRMVVCGVSLTW